MDVLNFMIENGTSLNETADNVVATFADLIAKFRKKLPCVYVLFDG
ncbi:hypothetical protein [Lysinibacillus sp. RS5]